jgi:hypothetical protein
MKKIIAIVTILMAAAFALAACGGSQQATSHHSSSRPAVSQPVAPPAPVTPTAMTSAVFTRLADRAASYGQSMTAQQDIDFLNYEDTAMGNLIDALPDSSMNNQLANNLRTFKFAEQQIVTDAASGTATGTVAAQDGEDYNAALKTVTVEIGTPSSVYIDLHMNNN